MEKGVRPVSCQDVQPELRRRYARKHEYLFAFVQGAHKDYVWEAVTNNIGGGGLSLDTERFVAAGTVVSLELYTPVDENGRTVESAYMQARVAWVKPLPHVPGGNRYRLGMEFMQVAPRVKAMVSRRAGTDAFVCVG